MELFIVLALSANVLLTAVCAYCLSVALSSNTDAPETAFLHKTGKITRKFVIVGGVAFLLFVAWGAVISIGSAYLA